jgi:RNA-directed DNA polymerase
MRRTGGIWESLISFSNLSWAATKAARSKRAKRNVARFLYNFENEICLLQDELRNKTYMPGAYRAFWIYEPKMRMISAAPFRDRVVHHALCRHLERVFEPTFIEDSYACRKRKGTHAALDRFTVFARRNKYVLKCDVRKFFPSIDREILKKSIARKIKDKNVLWLAGLIIDRSNDQEPVYQLYAGDDLFTPLERQRGLPIGNQTSQFFSNIYLNPLDHFIKEKLRICGYIRYVDDFVIFSDDKNQLADIREECRSFLATLRLRLHPKKSIISRVKDGTRFLGFRVFPMHRLLIRENTIRMRRRMRRLQKEFSRGDLSVDQVRQRLVSWIGHARHGDTYRLRKMLISGIKFTQQRD